MRFYPKDPSGKVPASRPAKERNDAASTEDSSALRDTQQVLGNQGTQRLLRSAGVQGNVRISPPNDPQEQAADRIAESALAKRAHADPGGAPARAAPAAAPGAPLPPALRQDMEERFDHDFSRVRLHSGGAAEQSARELDAHAYTAGQNIVFGGGEYRPDTESGRRLLAHELAHVTQSAGAASTTGSNTIYRQPAGGTPQERLNKAKGFLSKTELGQSALLWLAGYRKRPSALSHSLEASEIKIELRKGVASFYDAGNRKIVLNEDETAQEMALSLIDLQFRSVIDPDPLKVDRTTYSDLSMHAVTEGALRRIEFKREAQALGIGFSAAVPLEAEYDLAHRTTYAQALPLDVGRSWRDISPDAKYKAQSAARQAVYQAISSNKAITGGTRQQYTESFGTAWDKARAEQARRDAESAERARIEAEQQARVDATVSTLALIVNKADPNSPAADQVIRLVAAIVPTLGVSRFSFYTQANEGLERLLGPFGFRTVSGTMVAKLQAERLEYALANYAAMDAKQRAELRRDPFAPMRHGIQVGPTRAEQYAENQIVAYRVLPDGSLHVGPLWEFRQAEEQNKINHALEQIESIRNSGPGALIGRIGWGEEGAAIGAMADTGLMVLAPAKARRDVRRKISKGWQSPGSRTPLEPEAIRQPLEPELKMPRKVDVTQRSAFPVSPTVEAPTAPPPPAKEPGRQFRFGTRNVDQQGVLTAEGVGVLRQKFPREMAGLSDPQVKDAFARDLTIGRRGGYHEALFKSEVGETHAASKKVFVAQDNKNFNAIFQELQKRAPGKVTNTAVLKDSAGTFADSDPVLQKEISALNNHPNPSVREGWRTWYNSFKKGKVGAKKPDTIEFLLDRDLAVVSDPTLAVPSEFGPIHRFKTLFYKRVLETTTAFEVGAMDVAPGIVHVVGD